MKNEKKFAFLVRKSNEALYDSCLKSLQSLRLPAGYEAELFTLTAEAPYAAQANRALALSDAKYKIYINDDLRLVYAHLLADLPAIFENESIGMVGALGSRSLPTDGNVLGADDKQGAVYVPAKTRLSELRFGEGAGASAQEAVPVRFVLPSFFATQEDLPWDESCETQYYAVLAQCRGFEKAGRRIVVPLPQSIWCAYQSQNISFDAADDDHERFFARYYPYIKGREADNGQNTLYACGEGAQLPSWRDFSHPEGIAVGSGTRVHRTASLGLALPNFTGDPRLIVGDHCTIGAGSTLEAAHIVELEGFVSVAENVHIKDYACDETAIGLPLAALELAEEKGGIRIGRGVRIEENARIKGAVQIGRGSFIRAGSRVQRDIPAYCIAEGSPARVVRALSFKTREWLPVAAEHELADLLGERGEAAPLLTFAFITYNRSAYLKRSLPCVLRQLGNDALAEVLVADNASTDDTRIFVEGLQKTYGNLRYHCNEENVGAEANIHRALRASRGEYVLVAGDDDYFADGSLPAVLGRILQQRGAALFHLKRAREPYRLYAGSGIADYIRMVGYHMTWITSTILRRDLYARIAEPEKYNDTRIPQVYLQMEILKQEPRFAVIAAPFMEAGSGAHATAGLNFAEVFIKNYFDLLKTAGAIPPAILSEEKKRLMEELIYFWCERIKQQKMELSLAGIFDIVRAYYGNEAFYPQVVADLKRILRE